MTSALFFGPRALKTGSAGMGEFFAPAATDMVDELVGQYRATRSRLQQISGMITGEVAGAMSYFLEGNGRDSRYGTPSVERLFQLDGAVAALNSAYWSKALALTDVFDAMPQKRRDEWNKAITDQTCPAFEEETVRSTLMDLLNKRSQFLAERVDGIFRGLSGEHVTNSPAAFGKRMIVGGVLSGHGYENHSQCGLINDLRCVIAKFMGRDEPNYSASSGLIRSLKGRWGQWMQVDGGSLKVRLYMRGTAHIEVHPDMAWRLNSILAHLYPLAIPPEFRQKPKRKIKKIDLIQRPLPFSVVSLLAGLEPAVLMEATGDFRYPYKRIPVINAVQFSGYDHDKHARAEAESVIESIGGMKCKEGWFQFDYPPTDVIAEIVASGCVPDQKAHQFYSTPEALAQRVVDLSEIGPDDACLEPSAGTAAIADLMPKDRTLCIEVSQLRCDVLKAKGHDVRCSDFLTWASTAADSFDRVLMNPPFDQGRWKAHLEAAAGIVRAGGRLVAVLPSGARNSAVLPGFSMTWYGPFDHQFVSASVSVVILVAESGSELAA